MNDQNTKYYHKLVRDKIPEVIHSKGMECDIRVLDNHEYLSSLHNKLEEEVQELLTATTEESWVEEMADVYEVLLALLKAKNLTVSEMHSAREKKLLNKGGFEKKIFLEKTINKSETVI